MAATLYCRNLCEHVSSSDLEHLFAGFGRVVSAKIVAETDSGSSDRCGYVAMSSKPEAVAAIRGLNNIRFNGRMMEVVEAKPTGPSIQEAGRMDSNRNVR